MYHKDMEVWKVAVDLVTKIYKETKLFLEDEKYCLVLQIRRSAISIPSNIAEGCGRKTDKDSARFIDIAIGSISELETQLIISEKLGYLKNKDLFSIINKLYALLLGTKKYFDNKIS